MPAVVRAFPSRLRSRPQLTGRHGTPIDFTRASPGRRRAVVVRGGVLRIVRRRRGRRVQTHERFVAGEPRERSRPAAATGRSGNQPVPRRRPSESTRAVGPRLQGFRRDAK